MQTTIFFYFKKNLHKLTLWLKMSQDTYLWLNGDDALDFPQKSKLKDLDGFGSFLINRRKLENWVFVSVYVHRISAVNCRGVLSYFTCVSQPNQMCQQQISQQNDNTTFFLKTSLFWLRMLFWWRLSQCFVGISSQIFNSYSFSV